MKQICLFECTSAIATAAMKMLGGDGAIKKCRKVDIMADAAYVILTRDSRSRTGEFLIDEDVLREVGVTDLEQYSCVPGQLLAIVVLKLYFIVSIDWVDQQ